MKGLLIKKLIKENKKWTLSVFNRSTNEPIVVGKFDSFKESAESLKNLKINSII